MIMLKSQTIISIDDGTYGSLLGVKSLGLVPFKELFKRLALFNVEFFCNNRCFPRSMLEVFDSNQPALMQDRFLIFLHLWK